MRVVTFRMDEDTYYAMKEYIEATGFWESMSDFIRWLIRMYFKKRGVIP